MRSLALVCEIVDNRRVHAVRIDFNPEYIAVELDLPDDISLHIIYINFWHNYFLSRVTPSQTL